jgi:hypothetical protein
MLESTPQQDHRCEYDPTYSRWPVRFRRAVAISTIAVTIALTAAPGIAAEPPATTINVTVEDPADPTVIYAATDTGLFRSADSGDSWQPIPVTGADTNIAAIAVSPTDSQRLLAGSHAGLFSSTDGGATWAKVRNPRSDVSTIMFPPGNGSLIAVGTLGKGLYVSIDGGLKFKPRKAHLPRPIGKGSKTPITGAALDPSNSNVGWVGTEVNGIYRMEGTKFYPPENGTSISLTDRARSVLIAVDPQTPATVYGLIPEQLTSATFENRLYRSTDGGHSWPQVTVVGGEGTLTALYFRPGDPTTLYARDRTTLVAFDLASLHWVSAPLPRFALGPRAGSTSPTVFDSGDITVIVDDGTIMRTGHDGTGRLQCDDHAANDDINWAALARAFYGPPGQRRLPSTHDMVSVFPSHKWIGRIDTAPGCNQPIVNTSGGAGAYSLGVRNAIKGIGLNLFDNDPDTFPPPLTRLLNLGDKLNEFTGCNPLVGLYVFAHEAGHTWMTSVRYRRQNGEVSRDLIDPGGHWTLGTNSGGSPVGGVEWQDDGGGNFSGVGFGYKYGPMDQYLMGLRSAFEVNGFFFVRIPTPEDVVQFPLGVGTRGGLNGGACQAFIEGKLRNSTAEPIDVSQIIAVEGHRTGPTAALLHQAFILLLPPGETVDSAELAELDQRRLEWSSYFHRATDGRGRMETCLRPPCGSCGDGAISAGEQCDGAALGGATCGTLGLSGGPLSCTLDCRYDLSQCHSTCGNGVREGGELCDGTDLNGVTCQNSGFSGGQARCTSSCSFDLSGCTSMIPQTIRGTKVRSDGSPFNSGVIRLDGASPTTNNPFSYDVTIGDHRLSSDVPAGFAVSVSVCVNCSSHASSSFTATSSFQVRMRAGDVVDVQWKYTPLPTTGTVQGIKIDANNQQFDTPTISLDGGSPTTANPYTFSGIASGPHSISSSIPSGFAVSHAVCVNCTNAPSSTFTAGSSVSVTVPAGGFVDVWWKYTPTTLGAVQGIKIDANNQAFNSPTISLDGASPTTANPYSFGNVTSGSHSISSSVPSGFSVSHAICVNCTNTPNSTFTSGSSVSVSVPSGGFVDVWWKYTPTNPGTVQGIKIDANNQAFDGPTITLDGGLARTVNPYAYTNLLSGLHTVATTVPNGFTVTHAVCVNCTNTPSSTFTAGNSVSVSLPAGGFVDVWWKYTPTNPGVVQGIKIDANNQAFDSPTITLDGGLARTVNPYTYTNLPSGSHTVATTVPNGFTVTHAVCVNCTNTPSSTFTAGSSVSVSVPAGGFVDVWWKYTPTNPGVVQGIKINGNNQAFDSPTITLDGGLPRTANPYSFTNLAPGNHTVSSTTPTGLTVSHAVCVNCTNTPSSTFTPGSSVTVQVPAGGFVDVWWKYQ